MKTKAPAQNWSCDPDLFMAIEDLELAARGIVEGALQGIHRSPYMGFSVEFDSHRQYMQGDDLRHVNWNLWGRTDKLYVKQFRSDTNLHLYLMMDTTGSMLCANGPTAKWKYAARIAAAMAFLALSSRDAAGISFLSSTITEHMPARVRPGQLAEILSLLQTRVPGGEGDIAQSFQAMTELCRRRGIVVLFSDLFNQEEDILSGLRNLRCYGHDVILIQILDPWEKELPDEGQYEFRDLETQKIIQVHTGQVRESYNAIVEKWQADIRQQCENNDVHFINCTAHDPLDKLLIDYLLERERLY